MNPTTLAAPAAAFLDRDLDVVDPDVAGWIRDEERRQNEGLELIASENFVSRAVREAQGSVLTNKYAEGYPGRRYYGGCEFIDRIEAVAIERVKKLFGAEHANVQPHSGSQANMAVYMTVLKPGNTILGMNLSHGGHLTHGHPLSYSGFIEGCLRLLAGDSFAGDVHQHQMGVRPIRDNPKSALLKTGREGAGVVDNLLLVGLEAWR